MLSTISLTSLFLLIRLANLYINTFKHGFPDQKSSDMAEENISPKKKAVDLLLSTTVAVAAAAAETKLNGDNTGTGGSIDTSDKKNAISRAFDSLARAASCKSVSGISSRVIN